MLADEGDVGSVQGGDHGNHDALVLEDLARHVGGIGVRNRVVHVQQVKLFALHHLNHHARQGELVGLVLKERIVLNLNLVKVEVGLKDVHARGHGIADHVNTVSLARQKGCQLSGEHSGPSEGGVANDSDAH